MRGVNRAIIVGNLGNDPETRYMTSGGAITNFSVATSEKWKDKQTGEDREKTEWHRIVFFGKLAEIAGEYLRKGSKVYVEGKIRTEKWQDKETGQDRYTTKIYGDQIQMLDSRGDNQVQSVVQSTVKSNNSYAAAKAGSPDPSQSALDDFDEDIPF